jgi:hypothetical protein
LPTWKTSAAYTGISCATGMPRPATSTTSDMQRTISFDART